MLVIHEVTGFWKLLRFPEAVGMFTLLCNASSTSLAMIKVRAVERFYWLPMEKIGKKYKQVNYCVFQTYLYSHVYFIAPLPSLYLSYREPSRPTSLPPADWSFGLGLGREDEPLPPGLETIPLRLMQQDCTAVKTLLLRLRRTLQEVRYVHTDTRAKATKCLYS